MIRYWGGGHGIRGFYGIKSEYLPYKTLFPPGIQLHNPPSFLVEQARFARIKVACVADYQIREIPITGAGPPKIVGKMNLLRCIFWLYLNKHLSVFNTSHTYEIKNGRVL